MNSTLSISPESIDSNEKQDDTSSTFSSTTNGKHNTTNTSTSMFKKIIGKIKFKNIFEKTEDRPTPPQVYNYRIYMTALMASAAAIIIGYDSGFIGGAVSLPSFQREFGLDKAENSAYIISNVISVFHVGCFFGAIFSYPASHYFGRRIPLIAAALLVTLGSGIMLAANGSVGLGPMYAGRVLTGLAIGCSSNLTVVYISEISPPAIRGQLTASYEIGWRIGDLVGFFINYGLSQHISNDSRNQWYIAFAIQLIPSGLFLLGGLFMKESPRWLIQVGRYEEAIKNLTWLRNLPESDEYIIYEVNQCKESVEEQRQKVGLGIMDPFYEVFFHNRKLLYRLFITVMLFIFCNFMGIQAVNYYSPKIFQGLGVKGVSASLLSSGLFGVVKFVMTFVFILFIVDSVGRRPAFMVSSTICSICFWYIGAFLKVDDPTKPGNNAGPAGKAAIGLIYVWIAFFMAWSSLPWLLGAESFDQNVRTFVQSINASASWIAIFVMARWTQTMISSMHYGIYFFFAMIALISVPFVYFLIPETKGVSLEQMDRLFSIRPVRKAHKIVLTSARRENEEIFNENHDNNLFKTDTRKPEVETCEDILVNERNNLVNKQNK
ncbi:qutD [Candida pseudojiufengensis]|uniref:qutD n=1 Tax=Candida pseudojiufengensis TaxID=497109 RepID=UPI002224A744|nr:qutD [Candida pseudojiufengensis]KAI5962700.1 qutD [Candida pseudojiufengensis]